jgi:8-oxo-dGTP pyrophosphatase MutT (NUDIX family)
LKKVPALRPRDAATLIIVRGQSEVLLGVRSAKHVFMPHMYVFPGGKVDGGDARVSSPMALRPEVEAKLTQSVSAARARALAMTAVRETFEETGLIIGRKTNKPPQTRSPGWRPFFATGFVPALDKLDYVARAITPPGGVRRFDARFFLVDAAEVSGELNGNGELEDLAWVPLATASSLPLSEITEMMLDCLRKRLTGADQYPQQIPFYRERFGREVLESD